jgi:outer membrane protein TolC
MKRLLPAIILFPVMLSAQTIQKLELSDCFKLAKENHPIYSDKQRITNNTELKIKTTNTQWLPQLNANGQATYQSDALKISLPVPNGPSGFTQKSIETNRDQYKLTLDVNQAIYDGGAINAQKQIVKASSEVELMQNESDIHKVYEQINQAYFNLLLLQENKKLLTSVKNTLEQRKLVIASALKNGVLQQSDMDAIEVELLKNKQQTEELSISYSNTVAILAELTSSSITDSINISLPTTLLPDSIQLQRPELIMFDLQKNAITASDKLSQSQRLPKVYAFAQAGYGRPGLNMLATEFAPFYIVGLTLKWNIWDWNKTRNDRQTLVIQNEMTQSKRNFTEKNIKIAVLNSQSKMKQLTNALVTDQSIVNLRSEITNRSENKLNQGVITSSDYINDLNAEIQAKIQQQSHKIQLEQEKVNYLITTGVY